MRTRTIAIAAAALAALATAATATAAPPFSFGGSKQGTFTVTAGVLPSDTSVDLRGVWNDPAVACNVKRSMRVRAEIFFTPASGTARRVVREKKGMVGNCAEGGPNFGFTIPATTKNMACPDGTWKPGTYSFVTFARMLPNGIRAYTSLNWDVEDAC